MISVLGASIRRILYRELYREGLVSALRAYIGIAVGGADFIILQGKMDFFEPYFFFDRG